MTTASHLESDHFPSIPKPVWLVPVIMLVAALAPWPYGYFMLMRLVVCGAAAWLAFALLQGRSWRGLGWTLVAVALLYNPVFRVHFERELWMALNVLSALPFAMAGWRSGRNTNAMG